MELFSMLAKLTLDASDFESKLKSAEQEANSFDIDDPSLGLDDSEFQQGIEDANDAEVDDLDDPSLGIDDSEFTSGISDANEAEVDDLDDPKLGLDDSEFTQGLQTAQSEGESFGSVMGQVFENVKTALVTTGIVSMIGAFVGYLKQGVVLAGQNGDAIDKQSQKMNLSAKAYQEWNYVLGLSGASIDDLNRGLRNWQQSAGDEEAVKKLSDAFGALGIDAEEAFKKIENGENLDELLDQVLYGLSDKSSGERGWIAEALFGKNSTQLNALFNQTSQQIKDAKEEANDLGLIMTDEEVKNAAAYTDATSRLQQAVEGLQTALAGSLLPMLTDAANQLAKIVALFNWRTGEESLADQFDEIDKNGVDALKTLEMNEAQANSLIDKLASMGDYWTLDDSGKKTFDALAKELVGLFPQLDEVINNNKNAIHDNTEEIRKNIDEWTKLEQQRILDQNLVEKRQAIAEQYAAALDKEIQADVKETEMDARRADAIAEMNKRLRDNWQFQNAFSAGFGAESVDENNIADAIQWMRENGYDMTGMKATKEFSELQKEVETLRSEADALTEAADEATEDYTKFAEKLAERLGITIDDTKTATSEVEALKAALDSLPHAVRITIGGGETLMQKAIGDAYIPYDMPIYAHRGEQILTATEARKRSSGSMDYSTLRSEITGAIRDGMNGASVNSYLNGQDITDNVDRDMIRKLKARRFAT